MTSDPTILETTASGELRIPASILRTGPATRFRVEHEGQALLLIPEQAEPSAALPAGERASAFHNWVASLPKRQGPAIPAEALRRESLYD
jgi:hypothetical protein